MAHGHRLGPLQMGVAGHDRGGVLRRLFAQGLHQFRQLLLQAAAHIPQGQADVQGHLVVAAAAGVQALAGVADAGGEGLLHEGVNVLGLRVNGQRPALQVVQDALQPAQDLVRVLLGDDALGAQHGRMGHAAGDVLMGHTLVEPDGRVEIVHAAVHRFRKSALPKLRHGSTLLNSEFCLKLSFNRIYAAYLIGGHIRWEKPPEALAGRAWRGRVGECSRRSVFP